MYERQRNIVVRPDGRRVNVARYRGQLLVCQCGCCCGRVEDGFAPVPADAFHREWEHRRLRGVVHLTMGGCLGPCALANVVLLLFDGQAQWFHSITESQVGLLYDHVERMLDADAVLPPPSALAVHHFTASSWQPRPDGQPVDDARRWRIARGAPRGPSRAAAPACSGDGANDGVTDGVLSLERLLTTIPGVAAVPRKNGELVFEEPWQGRVFGMAVALHEQGVYDWEEFRQSLIAHVAAAEARGGRFVYYEVWLATFEDLLARRAVVSQAELDERTFQFEFGERDDVF